MADVVVRSAEPADVEAITSISNALLDTTAIEWTEQRHPVLVATVDGEVMGWASYGEFRDNARWQGYRFTVEHTIHVRESGWGAGIGRALLSGLVARARTAGMHTMIAGVDGENDASIRFHERLGFVEVARMPEVGAKHGRWLELVLLAVRLDDRAHPPSEDA